METTEKITEQYIRYVKNWLTMSNIRCGHGKEIDIIAFDTRAKQFYHIEVGVTFSGSQFQLRAHPGPKEHNKKTGKYKRRNSVDFFIDKKFNDPDILQRLHELKFSKAKNIIVSWRLAEEEAIQYAKSKNIEVWQMRDFLKEFADKLRRDDRYYVDDIIRTIQLVVRTGH